MKIRGMPASVRDIFLSSARESKNKHSEVGTNVGFFWGGRRGGRHVVMAKCRLGMVTEGFRGLQGTKIVGMWPLVGVLNTGRMN